MKWIKTGHRISQAMKSAPRVRHVVAVFVRHGFSDVVHRMDLGKFLPNRLYQWTEPDNTISVPVRLRQAFEELGPTFVKLGQILSTRPDVMPEAFIDEFVKLQDQVQTVPFEAIKETVERDLGRPLTELYAEFSHEPLASASIAQVHEARLKTGEKVVVKVQRPEIAKIIGQDITILAFLAGLLEKYVPETRLANPSAVVDEFFRTLSQELNFFIEANNISRIGENLASFPDIVVPKVYRELSSQLVLTMEKFEGIRVNDMAALRVAGIDTKKIAKIGARAFFKAVMLDGIFHGDLHGGNLFVLPGNRLGIIDFGIVGRLSQRARDQLANMVMALLSEDFETLAYLYAELGAANPSIDFDAFQRDLRNALLPFMGLSLAQMNTGKILIEATKIATRYQVKVPGEWMIVFKAILTTEGMGRSLDPNFNMTELGHEFIKDLAKNQYSVQKLSKEALFMAKDLLSLFQTMPRQIRWMMKRFNRNDFAFEIKVPGLDTVAQQMERTRKSQFFATVISGLLIAGALSLEHSQSYEIFGQPAISMICFMSAGFFLIRSLLK